MHTPIILAIVVIGITLVLIGIVANTRRLITVGVNLAKIGQKFTAYPSRPEKHILVVGDSSAVGVGAATPAESVAGRLGADFPNAKIDNLAVSGSRTKDLISVLHTLSNQEVYDLMLIQIGGNDIVRSTPLTNLEQYLDQVLNLAKRHAHQVVLLTCGNVGTSKLLPFGTRWYFTLRTKWVRNLFMRLCAAAGVHYVDLYRRRSQDPYAKEPSKYYSADYFHPSGDGYKDWYSFVRPVVLSLPGFRPRL